MHSYALVISRAVHNYALGMDLKVMNFQACFYLFVCIYIGRVRSVRNKTVNSLYLASVRGERRGEGEEERKRGGKGREGGRGGERK